MIKFNPTFKILAKELALGRQAVNEKLTKSNPAMDAGAKKNLEMDIKGNLGEIIAIDHLNQKGKSFEIAQMLATHPEKSWDIKCGNKKIDVKTLYSDKKYSKNRLMINKDAHHKGKGVIDLYWFVIVENNTASFKYVEYKEVEDWSLAKNNKRDNGAISQYYYIDISK